MVRARYRAYGACRRARPPARSRSRLRATRTAVGPRARVYPGTPGAGDGAAGEGSRQVETTRCLPGAAAPFGSRLLSEAGPVVVGQRAALHHFTNRLERHFAKVVVESLDQQDAVEMIELVLEEATEQLIGF